MNVPRSNAPVRLLWNEKMLVILSKVAEFNSTNSPPLDGREADGEIGLNG